MAAKGAEVEEDEEAACRPAAAQGPPFLPRLWVVAPPQLGALFAGGMPKLKPAGSGPGAYQGVSGETVVC